MRVTWKTIEAWVRHVAASTCTPEQLRRLGQLAAEAEVQAAALQRERLTAKAKLEVLAAEAGYSDVLAFLRAAVPDALSAVAGPLRVAPRRPYFDPLSALPELLALTHCRRDHYPDWVKTRLAEGWDLEELHYKKHRVALKVRGLTPLYDSVAKFKELAATTTAVRWVKKVKKAEAAPRNQRKRPGKLGVEGGAGA